MLWIEPKTFEFEKENRTNCAIKICFPDFYRKKYANVRHFWSVFCVLRLQFDNCGLG